MASTSDNTLAALVGSAVAEQLITAHVTHLTSSSDETVSASPAQHSSSEVLTIGLAALDAFLQANVTGPVLPADESTQVEKLFVNAWNSSRSESHGSAIALHQLRRACLKYLEVDGVAPYAYIPYLELFSLAKYILIHSLTAETKDIFELPSTDGTSSKRSLSWEKLRVNVWHYKIITQPSLGSGSNFTKSSQWSDVPTLATQISNEIDDLRGSIISNEVWATEETWTKEEKALFLVEAANNYILLGRYDKAKETLAEAVQATGVVYALSGALGKRTKFQEHNISQLVVFARSASEQDATTGESKDDDEEAAKPDSLKLNNDTLLEEIKFAKEPVKSTSTVETLPPALSELSPDDQPQLSPLDEIILLTEATIKDAFSPADTLTSEQILPFAVRVLTDKSVNWQIYTQALLVRSRIEIHRSRTVERGVLQLQAVADQVLTDTTFSTASTEAQEKDESDSTNVPAIQVTAPGQAAAPVDDSKPTTFLPAATNSESAPAHVRLRYIHALSTPPRWHLESELAYAWAGVGSMTSALEIFKRLKLWAEVALCFASSAAADDEDGRGSGGEDKAKGIIRWRLFNKTGVTAPSSSEPEDEVVGQDVSLLKAADFSGVERQPPPPDAARLWCILGDLENNPAHYERAWEISKHRYARAQRSLGEHYLGQKDLAKALDAYKKATNVNRLSPDMWGRLGDISLRLGEFEEAAEAYSRSISCANDTDGGEGARTWSNLGSALYSLYSELTAPGKDKAEGKSTNGDAPTTRDADEDEEDVVAAGSEEKVASRDPNKLLSQSLAAYKKGASIAHDNWRIWDNVVTLASRVYPTPVADMVLAITNIIRIRKSEDALDVDVLSALLQDVVLSKDKPSASNGIYEPPRGSVERLLIRLIEEEVTPLITTRSELWTLVSRLRAWRCDFAGAIEASERAWRAAVGSSGSGGSGLLPGESASGSADWTSDEAAWAEVVKRTDELVSVLENWGPDIESIGQKWKGKARSAVRSVMGRAKATWEDSEGWRTLENLMEGLKTDRS
ncbi:tpr repeat-containing [Trichoderma arundinaceum]|uniref:Tpr repeat-containing n=1 Tax=Trichoderma arundinaceum TaxID=490622 RepID=A0A395NL83_TRIAR|nr:tpr repeat-containing [Trichoderma arundinaceum]